MLKHWGQKPSKGFHRGQMLPLITAEQPLKKKESENVVNVQMEANQMPLWEIFKDFFPVVHLDWKDLGE